MRPTGARRCLRRRRSGRPREPGRDLVDGAVEVVDAALERDGEVDEVGAAAAEQDALRRPEPSHAYPQPEARSERDRGRRGRRDGDDQGGGHRLMACPVAFSRL